MLFKSCLTVNIHIKDFQRIENFISQAYEAYVLFPSIVEEQGVFPLPQPVAFCDKDETVMFYFTLHENYMGEKPDENTLLEVLKKLVFLDLINERNFHLEIIPR